MWEKVKHLILTVTLYHFPALHKRKDFVTYLQRCLVKLLTDSYTMAD